MLKTIALSSDFSYNRFSIRELLEREEDGRKQMPTFKKVADVIPEYQHMRMGRIPGVMGRKPSD